LDRGGKATDQKVVKARTQGSVNNAQVVDEINRLGDNTSQAYNGLAPFPLGPQRPSDNTTTPGPWLASARAFLHNSRE
jgi:hypothetical protein